MDNIDKIWKEYDKTNNPKLKEMLIVNYAQLVKDVAERLNIYFYPFVENEDLTSYGIFGLIDAIEKFDYKKGIKFERYATFRIRGSIIDSVRQLDGLPRTLRKKNIKLIKAYFQLEEELGRTPRDFEIANKLDISEKEVKEIIKKSSMLTLISLEEYFDNDINIDFQTKSPLEDLEKEEVKSILVSNIEKLNEKEKKVVTLYYYENLTSKEISRILNVSEARISQIHSKAIFNLQNKLGKYKSILFT